jgi:hypothetical protein
VLLPFDALPFVTSYLTFQFVSAALLAGTLCFATDRSTPKALIACFALASPAASFNIVGGQNAFLIAALLIVGLGCCVDDRWSAAPCWECLHSNLSFGYSSRLW